MARGEQIVERRLRSDPDVEVGAAVRSFCAQGSDRSVLVCSLRGPALEVAVDADVVRPAASLLKLAIAVAALEAERDGALHDSVPVDLGGDETSLAIALEGAGSIADLCTLALATSDNAAAQALLKLAGRDRAAAVAARLGGPRTRLRCGFGESDLGPAGRRNETTAREALALLRGARAADPRIDRALAANIRNGRIPLYLPEGVEVRHKSGSLDGVVNDVAIVAGERCDLGIAVLCDGEPDPGLTALEIGRMAAAVRRAVGESATPCSGEIGVGRFRPGQPATG